MNTEERSVARQTLLAAATTCNAFKNCALDALWRVIPSLIPLLQLFPSFAMVDDIYVSGSTFDWQRGIPFIILIIIMDLGSSGRKRGRLDAV